MKFLGLQKQHSIQLIISKAHIERKEMQYLYEDGLYYFMDKETYEQIPLNHSKVEDAIKFLKEDMFVIKFYKGDAFSVEPPNFVELVITKQNQE